MTLSTGPVLCLSAGPLLMLTILTPGGVNASGTVLHIGADLTPAHVPSVEVSLEVEISTFLAIPGLDHGPIGALLATPLIADLAPGVDPTIDAGQPLGIDLPLAIDLRLGAGEAPGMIRHPGTDIVPGADCLPPGAGPPLTTVLAPLGILRLQLLMFSANQRSATRLRTVPFPNKLQCSHLHCLRLPLG